MKVNYHSILNRRSTGASVANGHSRRTRRVARAGGGSGLLLRTTSTAGAKNAAA